MLSEMLNAADDPETEQTSYAMDLHLVYRHGYLRKRRRSILQMSVQYVVDKKARPLHK